MFSPAAVIIIPLLTLSLSTYFMLPRSLSKFISFSVSALCSSFLICLPVFADGGCYQGLSGRFCGSWLLSAALHYHPGPAIVLTGHRLAGTHMHIHTPRRARTHNQSVLGIQSLHSNHTGCQQKDARPTNFIVTATL